MKKYIIVWKFHDTHIEFFKNEEELKNRYYKLIQEYRNYYSSFIINIYELKKEIEFI